MLRFGMAVLIFMMVQAVLFGIGAVLVLATPLKEFGHGAYAISGRSIKLDCGPLIMVVCTALAGAVLAKPSRAPKRSGSSSGLVVVRLLGAVRVVGG